MSKTLTTKKAAMVAICLSFSAVASAQDNSTGSATTGGANVGSDAITSGSAVGPMDNGATGTGTSAMPTTTGAGGSINSGTTYPAPTASPSPTPGFFNNNGTGTSVAPDLNSGATSPDYTGQPALNTTDGIPAGTGAIDTGPSAPSSGTTAPSTTQPSESSGSGM